MAAPLSIDIGHSLAADREANIDIFVATAVAMPNQFHPEDPTRPLLHWRGAGAFQLPNRTFRSTSFDTRKRPDKKNAVEVQLISKPFAASRYSVYSWEKALVREYTANNIYDLMLRERLNEYRYNGTGSGCLTWTTRLIQVLEEEGVLPAGSKMSFLEVVEGARADPEVWVPEEEGAEFAVDG